MRNIKTCSILFVLFLSIFFTVDRFGILPQFGHGISPFVYFLGISVVFLQILLGRVLKLPVLVPLLLTSIIYAICKSVFEGMLDLSQGSHVIVTLVEFILLLSITWISGVYSAAISDFEDIMHQFLFTTSHKSLKSVSQEREKIQIEIDRCRRYNHPLSVIVLRPDEALYKQTHNSALLEINKYITKDYLLNKFGEFMDESVRSHDLVFKLNKKGGLLLICPETPKEAADFLLQKLRKKAEEQFGTKLKCGTATFPNEFVTFDELLAKAELSVELLNERFQIDMEYIH